jgi:alpha-N-acetylglucosamine transferase
MEYLDNICAITSYRPGEFHKVRVSLYSFIKHNPWFDGKIIILTLNGVKPTEVESTMLDQIYKDFEYVDAKIELDPSLKKKLSKRSLDKNHIFDFLYLYSLQIKSKGNLFLSNSIVVNRDVSSFLHSSSPTFAVKEGNLPNGGGLSVNTSMFYIPGELCSPKLYERAMHRLGETTNIFSPECKSDTLVSALNDLEIPINYIKLVNLVDASSFPDSKYREFLRYNKAICAINMNTLESNDSRYTRMNLYWQSANKDSLNYKPAAAVVKNKTGSRSAINHLKELTADPRVNKIYREDSPESDKITLNELRSSKIALCTICNDDFIAGAQVMIHSFLRQNDWFKGDIIVMYSDSLSPLSDESKKLLLSIDPNIIFKPVDESDYAQAIHKFVNKSGLHLNFMPSLFTFEVFALDGYDAVMYVDSDIIHINSMLEMFRVKGDLLVTPASLSYPARYHHNFSGGVFTVRGSMISKSIKRALIKFAIKTKRFSLLDQTIMNDFFQKTPKVWVSNDFNCSKRCFDDSNFSRFDRSKISLIHYVAEKPWNTKKKSTELNYKKLESIWTNYYNMNIAQSNVSKTKKKVIVIGNSPNVSKYQMGNKIDQFDIVIRVNDFRTIGFEDYVGTKTDYVVTSFATNFKTAEYDSISSSQVMMSLFDKKGQNAYLNNRIERYRLQDVNVLPDRYYLDLNTKVGLNGRNMRCSSGTIALSWAIDNYPNYDIFIHGIDLIKTEAHYFKQSDEKTKAWKKSIETYHDFEKEKKYISSLIKSKIVNRLIG